MKLRIPTCDPATLPAEAIKEASSAGLAAVLGALLSQARRAVPKLEAIRETNPTAYDAALGASVMLAMEQLSGKDEGRPGEMQPGAMMQPGYLA